MQARVAQSVERGTFNPKVQGSSPCPGELVLPPYTVVKIPYLLILPNNAQICDSCYKMNWSLLGYGGKSEL